MVALKDLDRGQERWCGGSREFSTMAWRLRAGLDDGTGSGEVDYGMCSRKIFGKKFWQPDGVSESLRGLGFAKATQWFIYKGTAVAMGISDIIRSVATENHSSNGLLPSSDRC
jgi:hypothetical protein